MAVNQYRWQGGISYFFTVYDRMSRRRAHFHPIRTGIPQFLSHVVGSPAHVFRVGRIRTYRWKTEQVKQFSQKALLIGPDIFFDLLHND